MSELITAMLTGHGAADYVKRYPVVPLDWPGAQAPGAFYSAWAAAQANHYIATIPGLDQTPPEVVLARALRLAYMQTLYDPNFVMTGAEKGVHVTMPTVSGHCLSFGSPYGPQPSKVMVLGKNPGKEEVRVRRNFIGPSSEIFFQALQELGVDEELWSTWYSTSLVKWPPTNERSSGLPASHVKDCAFLLTSEIAVCAPDVIFCMGSDAVAAVLGKGFGVNNMTGRTETIVRHVIGEDGSPVEKEIKVLAIMHPAYVFRSTEAYPEFVDQFRYCLQVITDSGDAVTAQLPEYEEVYDLRRLRQIVDEIRSDPDPWRRVIAVDGEWEGKHPTNAGSYLRTIQFSSKEGEGVTVVLRHQGGEPAFVQGQEAAIAELRRLLKADPVNAWFPRVGGQLFRADLPWLISVGLDLREEYAPAPHWSRMRSEGGWDTGLMVHAVQETASFALSDMAVRFTRLPRYDQGVLKWKKAYCAANKLNSEELTGYGMCPDWTLLPYAGADADATRRIAVAAMQPGGMLDRDRFGNSSWEPYWRSHIASLGLLQMEETGLMLDRDRVDKLSGLYATAKHRMLHELRERLNWPKFNPDSVPQCVAMLFGDRYGYKIVAGAKVPIAPPEAVKLDLRPIKSTGKRPRMWDDIEAEGRESQFSPSCDKEVLGTLGHEHPTAMLLRDIKFIGHVMRGLLRHPVENDDGTFAVQDGRFYYTAGVTTQVCDDGRIRTHLSALKETGRGSSSRPNLQAISSRREEDYARILGAYKAGKLKGDYLQLFNNTGLYQHPVRSIFKAPPGYVLVGSDYKGAELAGLAWLSQDPTMIEHARRNALREDDPDFMDIHGNMAVRAFRLNCAPTKDGLKSIGRVELRTAAKNIIFGIPYGRQALAILRQCLEAGTVVSIEEIEGIMATYFDEYRFVGPFLEECRNRSQSPGWLAGSFGRFRRFIRTSDSSVVREQERQAQNFPIQNLVADALWQAIANFVEWQRSEPDLDFRLVLPIHDALLFQVLIDHLDRFLRTVLPECMVRRVPVYPRRLDNTPMESVGPYFFGLDSALYVNWGEELSVEQGQQLGIPAELFDLL